MVSGSSLFAVPNSPEVPSTGPQAGRTVVWLSGEHGVSTEDALCVTLARAIALDRDIVVDLSKVKSICACTLRVISRAQQFCWLRGQALTVRSPSPSVRQAITRCDLDDLFGTRGDEVTRRFEALGSWAQAMKTDWADGEPEAVIDLVAGDVPATRAPSL